MVDDEDMAETGRLGRDLLRRISSHRRSCSSRREFGAEGDQEGREENEGVDGCSEELVDLSEDDGSDEVAKSDVRVGGGSPPVSACEERQVGLEMKLLPSHAEGPSSLTRS